MQGQGQGGMGAPEPGHSPACGGSIPILFGLSLGRTLDPVHIPRTIDRDEQQRAFVRLGPGLMNRLAGHVVERARPQFMALPLLMLMMKVPDTTVWVSLAVCQCFGT